MKLESTCSLWMSNRLEAFNLQLENLRLIVWLSIVRITLAIDVENRINISGCQLEILVLK